MTLDTGDVDSDADTTIQHEAELGDEESEATCNDVTNEHLRKRRQNQIFDDWSRREAATTDFTALKTSRHQIDHQEVETIKDLLRKREGRHIIGSPHAFQTELFERAKAQNTLVVADTGSGKTLVSMLLLNHVMSEELEARASGSSRKVAFFVVEKVALMWQQYDCLQANLHYDVAAVCGQENQQRQGNEHKWFQLLQSNDIIVCTAEILHQCLMRSFINMRNINLLIFDEAHHAKKSHPFARIMLEYYKDNPNHEHRPRIFGMTASPVDVQDKEDINQSARELEKLLQCQIATCPVDDMLDRSTKPIEEIKEFAKSPTGPDSALFRHLNDRYRQLKHFSNLLATAREFSRTLGLWAGDAYWSFAFSDREAKKCAVRAERGLSRRERADQEQVTLLDEEIRQLHAAHADILSRSPQNAPITTVGVSPKVRALKDILVRHFENPGDTKCLVFVQRRETARLLHMLFQRLQLPNLYTGFLTGSSNRDFEGQRNTFFQQQSILTKFRKRDEDLNCIFATSVAEEGLDIPACNVVIRFDMCQTMIQYVQSRGRARQKHSRFVHLIERGNREESDRLEELHESEDIMKTLCNSLPPNRVIIVDEDEEHLHDTMSALDRKHKVLKIKDGGTLTWRSSLSILHQYVSCLPFDEMDDMSLRYNTFVRDGKFVSEVVLPERAQISPVTGRPQAKKIEARMSAAFEACKLLVKSEMLNKNLLPTIKDALHHMRDAHVALKSNKQHQYQSLTKPSHWAVNRGTRPERLFLTLLHLKGPWERPVRPLALLTRVKLPTLPSFPLVKLDGGRCMMEPISGSDAVIVDHQKLSQLTWFTLTFFEDVYNKKFENAPEKMSYWIAPLVGSDGAIDTDALDWALLQDLYQQEPFLWERGMPREDILNRFIIDPFDGGRRLFSKEFANHLSPSSPVPPNVAPGPKGASTIIEYSSSLFKQSKLRRTWQADQPVIAAEKLIHRLNALIEPTQQEQNASTSCFVCPEPLNISRLPADVAAMCLLFPSIIYRMENALIAQDFCEVLGLEVDPARALEAITKDSDNSDDAQAEQINVQHGMGPNYERLEFIGDTFLKMATTIATWLRNVGKDEFWLHADRLGLLCNVNMFNNAQSNDFVKYIRSKGFSRRTWYPEGLTLLKGKGATRSDTETGKNQNLSEKTIADVCEAMIGAALVSHVTTGREDTDKFDNAVKAVTAFVSSTDSMTHDMQTWDDYRKAYQIPTSYSEACTAVELNKAERVEKIHPYKFKHVKLLTSAFTHPSYPRQWAKAPNYQRLEFLGDSLLDMTAVKFLFDTYPTKDPQWMTEHKMAMVSNKFLAALCAMLGLGKYLDHHSNALSGQFTTFHHEYDEAEREAQRDAQGQAGQSRGFWQSLSDPPKALADVVEAYVGAMFVDSDFDFKVVQDFFDRHIKWFFEDMRIYDEFAHSHPINRLRDMLSRTYRCDAFSLKAKEVVSDDEYSSAVLAGVIIHSQVIGKASAKTSKVAKIHAANNAYEELHGMAPFEFRSKFGCECALEQEARATPDAERDEGTAV
ncbi:MAG: hypothetical protein Q9159_002383 [Coniocarpon cinnabarinum]